MSNYLSDSEIENICTLGAISFPRGDDSVGISWCHSGKGGYGKLKYGLDKVVSDPYGYLFHPNTVSFLKGLSSVKAIIGHNRAATIGDISKENAHPFRVNHIVGVHNGTIHSLKPSDGSTDSEALYTKIADKGLKDTLSDLKQGAYALAFFDMDDNTLNLIRNDERPLWYMQTATKPGTVYFASEKIFLDYINARCNTAFDTPVLLTPEFLYTFNLQHMGAPKIQESYVSKIPSNTFQRFTPEVGTPAWQEEEEQKTAEETTTTTREVEAPEQQTFLLPNFVTSPFASKLANPREVKEKNILAKCTTESADDYAKVIPSSVVNIPRGILLHNTYKSLRYIGYNGELLDPDELLERLRQGCVLTKVIPKVTDKLYWLNSKEFVTAENVHDPLIMEYASEAAPEEGKLAYVRLATYKQGENKSNVTIN